MKTLLIIAGWCSIGTGLCNAIMLYRSIRSNKKKHNQRYISMAERGFYGPDMAAHIRKANK